MKSQIYTDIENNLVHGIPVSLEVKDEKGKLHEHNYASTDMQQIVVELRRTYPNQLIDVRVNQLGLNYATLSIAC